MIEAEPAPLDQPHHAFLGALFSSAARYRFAGG
jgi:hypothetical protein